jgi:hypothetical protein
VIGHASITWGDIDFQLGTIKLHANKTACSEGDNLLTFEERARLAVKLSPSAAKGRR